MKQTLLNLLIIYGKNTMRNSKEQYFVIKHEHNSIIYLSKKNLNIRNPAKQNFSKKEENKTIYWPNGQIIKYEKPKTKEFAINHERIL